MNEAPAVPDGVDLSELFQQGVPEDDYFPGVDPDGKPRLDPFGVGFVAESPEMPADVIRVDEGIDEKRRGAVQDSPFVQ